ncbi:MAG: class I SAM-dependent methyltransferase [Anaerolineaceae bacterium]|nr:MAG: class I SAM-dependent methyltransferase [Anaerolineaceae bacterium]
MIKVDNPTDIKGSIRQGWEEVAVEYTKDRLGIFERCAGRLLELVHPSSGSSIFDVGCGSGAVSLQTTRWTGSEGLVIGSDIAVTMLNMARSKAEDLNTDLEFCQMDAEQLGLPNASFDNVTCAFSLFQFTDMEQALIEMWRVLKSGGRLGLSNWGTGYFSPIASIQRDLFRMFNLKPLLNNPLSFKPNELNDLLTRTGFSEVELIEETDEVWFNTPEEIWAFNMDMGPFPIMLRQQLSSDEQSRLFHQFKATMENLRTEQGIKSTFHLIYALAGKGDID